MLNVLFTVDAETFPITKNWKQDHLTADMKRDLYGEIDGHVVGLDYQLQVFARHRLKAAFMIESLFSAVPEVGPGPLKDTVTAVCAGGHDIQVHAHPEWIQHIPSFGIPHRSHLLRAYPLPEQEAIIRFAKTRLEESGAVDLVAFRAGGFAANTNTLHALQRCGLKYDSSFNLCYANDNSFLPAPQSYGQATDYSGVLELPVAVFWDRPFHFRPAQIQACSTAEMIHALDVAERNAWDFFVIVSHSFEMITGRRNISRAPRIRQVVLDRFERICEFLGSNRQRFTTVGFSDLNLLAPRKAPVAVKGKLVNTAVRLWEQAANRVQSF
jgi:hypothetical protein